VKKLLGKNDIEDALKRLDTLTQEEARMATAEVFKVTQRVDNNVAVLADGVQVLFSLAILAFLNANWLDGKEVKAIIQQTISDVDEEKRSSSLICAMLVLRLSNIRSEAVATGPSKMALPPGSVNESQHCSQGPPRGNSYLVF
jgi:hypothetical protein